MTTAPPAFTIGITDTLELWTVLATVLEETGNTQTTLDSIFESAYAWIPQPINPFCCNGIRGNVDSDPGDNIDIADLVYLVSYSFSGGDDPACFYEADVDNTGAIDIADIVYLVAYMFAGGPDPLVCD